jgi:hypothetical protein
MRDNINCCECKHFMPSNHIDGGLCEFEFPPFIPIHTMTDRSVLDNDTCNLAEET